MKLRQIKEGVVEFHCPGCNEQHLIYINSASTYNPTTWWWNGSFESPSFQPSVLMRSGHFVPGCDPSHCWCTYKREHPDENCPSCSVCHSFVVDGKIQFLGDCTHALAGQTVELPEWPR